MTTLKDCDKVGPDERVVKVDAIQRGVVGKVGCVRNKREAVAEV